VYIIINQLIEGMKKIILILSTILLATSCTKVDKEQFLFSSSRSGSSDIYLMDIETLKAKPLTNTAYEEWGPTWINENELSFLRQEDKEIKRYKLNLNTGEESLLAHPEQCILDDKNVLYASQGSLQLYTCNGAIFLWDEKAETTINITKDLSGTSAYPSWSFDEKEIIFTSNQAGTNDIFKYDLLTQKSIQLTNSDSNNERGELSPDAKYIVYSSNKFNPRNQDLLLQNLETGTLENITNSEGNELISRWSANGKSIYFGINNDGNWELYIYNLQNKSTKRITDNTAFDGDPRVYKR
jgi:Tol biopolymer transport system component